MRREDCKKEHWADEVLQSLDGIQSVSPPEGLFEKITQQLPSKTKIVLFERVRWVAAAAILLVSLNAFVLTQYLNQQEDDSDITEIYTLINDYTLYTE